MLKTAPIDLLKDVKHWKSDVPSGLVVFLVAIPLCLGIALASGSSAMSGIIAGIVGGLIVTLFSNSSLGVSGPAAGLVAIVAPAIVLLGFNNFLLAVVLAGVIQFLLGIFKAGTIGYYFPTSVIKGMLAAIGLIIILKQIPHAFGYDTVPEGVMSFSQADGYNTFTEIWHAIRLVTPSALVITLVCLAILIAWETKAMKSKGFTKIIQGPLVAVIAGILLTLAFSSSESMKLEKDHLVRLPVWEIDELPSDSIALDKPTSNEEARFQVRTIKEGPVVYQDTDGKYYRVGDSNKEANSLDAIPEESVKLDETTKTGQAKFQVRYVKDGPVYYQGEDGKYHLDAPLLLFPHFKPSAITSSEVHFGHGSDGVKVGDDQSAAKNVAKAEAKLKTLEQQFKGLSEDKAAELAPTVSGFAKR